MRTQVKPLQNVPIGESSSTTLSERSFATNNRSSPFPDITARPAGYGIAVPTAVLRTPKSNLLRGDVLWRNFQKAFRYHLPFSNL